MPRQSSRSCPATSSPALLDGRGAAGLLEEIAARRELCASRRCAVLPAGSTRPRSGATAATAARRTSSLTPLAQRSAPRPGRSRPPGHSTSCPPLPRRSVPASSRRPRRPRSRGRAGADPAAEAELLATAAEQSVKGLRDRAVRCAPAPKPTTRHGRGGSISLVPPPSGRIPTAPGEPTSASAPTPGPASARPGTPTPTASSAKPAPPAGTSPEPPTPPTASSPP